MKLNNSFKKNLNFIYYNIPIVFARLFKFKRKEHKMKKGSTYNSYTNHPT